MWRTSILDWARKVPEWKILRLENHFYRDCPMYSMVQYHHCCLSRTTQGYNSPVNCGCWNNGCAGCWVWVGWVPGVPCCIPRYACSTRTKECVSQHKVGYIVLLFLPVRWCHLWDRPFLVISVKVRWRHWERLNQGCQDLEEMKGKEEGRGASVRGEEQIQYL